ncbi:MAG: NTP transferase domain-containing protein [Candidatus Omnitrophica bacterium]|nr:NTP transferase domain-containing protein [Candidatus Omnitrophota bacterium]MDE2222819.1 NTP transferase domain-containing protein [Candidatus Omnitrophota bacterium]
MKATNPKLFGLILAGGYSKRMGHDKALLEFHGKPQVEFIHELLQQYCAGVFLSKRADQKPYKGLPFINDDPAFAGQGPLGGILSTMKEYPGCGWLVVACDLPLINNEALQVLIDGRVSAKTATAFISTYDGLPEPLCAIWEGQAYGAILRLFKEGLRCPRKVLIQSDICLLKQNDPHWLDNINTPQEYEGFKKPS